MNTLNIHVRKFMKQVNFTFHRCPNGACIEVEKVPFNLSFKDIFMIEMILRCFVSASDSHVLCSFSKNIVP